MSSHQKFVQALATLPLVAILRGLAPADALLIGKALASNDWQMIEVPLNSPEPLESISALSETFPQALVGAGTVLTVAEVRDIYAAGGELVVSPNFNPAVVREAIRLGMVCLPGVMTASEAFGALEAGASGLKMFPAEMASPAVVKALLAVLPAQTIMMPVGGISQDKMQAYLAAGAKGFGIGSGLYKPGIAASEIAAHAASFKDAFHAARDAL